MLWSNLTKAIFSKEFKKKTVIIPIGAIEAHGSHLPVYTDSCIVEYLAKKIADESDCLVIPTLSYGPCETMLSFAGTITISEETCYRLIEDIIESIIYQGFYNIFIINGHGGNDTVLAKIIDKFSKKVNIKIQNWFDLEFIKQLKHQDQTYMGDHADRLETEIMLAINDNNVKMELAINDIPDWPDDYKNLNDYSIIMKYAVEGYPTTASKKKGIILLGKIIKALSKEILINNKKVIMTKEKMNKDQFERKNFVTPEREPYICGHCDEQVMGGRFNNHCPKCLWSMHVDDKIPGDRVSTCQHLMQPVGVIKGKKDTWRIIQKCTGCKHRFTVNSSPEDNFDVIIDLSKNPIR